MTYFFETYGCQMNTAESASVEQLFLARGWTKAGGAQIADVAIINTCSVRETAENRVFGRLGWYAGLKALRAGEAGAKSKSLEEAADYVKDGAKPLTLVVMGCMAERLLDSLKTNHPYIDYVVGTFAKHKFGQIIEAAEEQRAAFPIDNTDAYKFAPLSYEHGSFTSFVPIMHGCNNFCTFCIVPHVRGRECSRPVSDILKEIDTLSSYGVKEITLLGQNVNSYKGLDENGSTVNFASLLRRIADRLRETKSPIGWVRFMSSHPKDLSDDVIAVIAQEDVLCRHIHLPVQHGSNDVLRRMNRGYTAEKYLALIDKIRSSIPDVSLTTDIMLGFPGETDEDFEKTMELMERVRYETAFMYYYNPREGTPAAKMTGQVSVKLKKARLQKVIDLQLKITGEEMRLRTGRTVKVLAESISRDSPDELLGKTEQDERVAFAAPKNLIGQFCEVYIEALAGNTFRGRLGKE